MSSVADSTFFVVVLFIDIRSPIIIIILLLLLRLICSGIVSCHSRPRAVGGHRYHTYERNSNESAPNSIKLED